MSDNRPVPVESIEGPAFNLQQYKVPGVQEVFYISEFVTEQEEEYLLRKIQEAPQPMWRTLANRRLQIWGGIIKNGVLVAQSLPDFLSKFPDLITRLRHTGAFASAKHGQPNHVIVNEYLAGQGIMPHEDGPAYHSTVATISLGSHAVFNYYKYVDGDSASNDPAGQSNTGRAIEARPIASLLLEPRSLVITRSALYTGHLHGIDEVKEDILAPAADVHPDAVAEDGAVRVANWQTVRAEEARTGGRLVRGTRVSLTCRDVERVLDVSKRFGR